MRNNFYDLSNRISIRLLQRSIRSSVKWRQTWELHVNCIICDSRLTILLRNSFSECLSEFFLPFATSERGQCLNRSRYVWQVLWCNLNFEFLAYLSHRKLNRFLTLQIEQISFREDYEESSMGGHCCSCVHHNFHHQTMHGTVRVFASRRQRHQRLHPVSFSLLVSRTFKNDDCFNSQLRIFVDFYESHLVQWHRKMDF